MPWSFALPYTNLQLLPAEASTTDLLVKSRIPGHCAKFDPRVRPSSKIYSFHQQDITHVRLILETQFAQKYAILETRLDSTEVHNIPSSIIIITTIPVATLPNDAIIGRAKGFAGHAAWIPADRLES